MANESLIVGNSNWAVKANNLLGYAVGETSGYYVPRELNFTRNSTATYTDENGIIQTAAANIARVQDNALLLEPQRTNSFTFSENITNFSTLGRLNCGYTLGSSFGSFTTSCLITSTSFTGSLTRGVIGFNSVNTENNYFTIRFQKKSGWYLNVISGNGCAAGDLRINLASGGGYISSSGTMLTDYKIVEFSDYFQIGFKTTQIATTSAGLVNLNLYDNASFANYNDAGGTTFNISGIQRENQQTYGTSYIPTSGATVTRLADACSKTGISSLIGQTEGTMFVEVDFQQINAGGYRIFAYLYNNSAPTPNRVRIEIEPTNKIWAVLNSSGVQTFLIQSNVQDAGNLKIAVAYKSGDSVLYINGLQIGTSSSTFSFSANLDSTSLVSYTGGNQSGNGVNEFVLFPTRLTNTQLAELTTL